MNNLAEESSAYAYEALRDINNLSPEELDKQIASKRAELAYLSGLVAGLLEKATARRALTPDFGKLEDPRQLDIETRILFGVSLTAMKGTGRDSRLTAARAYSVHRLRAANWKFKDIDAFLERQPGCSCSFRYNYGQEYWEKYIVRSYDDEQRIQLEYARAALASIDDDAGVDVSAVAAMEGLEAVQ